MRKIFFYFLIISGFISCNSKKESTLFELLPSSKTNIYFQNNLEYTEELNPYTYRNFYNGGGSTKTCFEHVKNLTNHKHFFIGSDEGEYKTYFSQIGKSYSIYRDSNFNYPELFVKEIIRKNKIDLIHFYLPGHENPSFLRGIDLPKICTFLCGQVAGFDGDIFDHVRFISEYNKNLNSEKYEIYSGPLHIISFLPKGMNIKDSNSWTLNTRIKLLKNNFMLSRPEFKGKYFLRAVLGNYNTSDSHIVDLVKILNSI